MTSKVGKWNPYNWCQERNFVITNENLYNFKNKKLRRVIGITSLVGLTKNMQEGSKEFVIHVNNEPDLRMICDYRDDFFYTVKAAFIDVKRQNLKVYGIGRFKTLSEFCTSERDVKKGQNRRPLALARLPEEDLMSDDDVKKALEEKKEQKDQEEAKGGSRLQVPK